MTNIIRVVIGVTILAATVALASGAGQFSRNVDGNGDIHLPADLRTTWVHLGTWIVPAPPAFGANIGKTGPGTGIHEVYAQQSSLNSFKKTGKWPDGSTLVMEVREITWDEQPTGHVMVEGEPVKWLVMVKDSKKRFPGNPNWGDGWGWALFTPAEMKKNASTNYKEDCLSCHELAKDSDLVFIQGYPALR